MTVEKTVDPLWDSLRRGLKQRGIGCAELGRKLGVSRSTAQAHLVGNASPRLDTLDRVADILDLELWWTCRPKAPSSNTLWKEYHTGAAWQLWAALHDRLRAEGTYDARAEVAGVSRATAFAWDGLGDPTPTLDTVRRLADHYGYKTYWLSAEQRQTILSR